MHEHLYLSQRTSTAQTLTPILSKHVCNYNCRLKLELLASHVSASESPMYARAEICERNSTLMTSFVNLHSFSLTNPMTLHGPLHEPDRVVIPHTEFSIHFYFPLSKPTTIPIVCARPITTRQLISLIADCYTSIYECENQMSSMSPTMISIECVECPQIENTFTLCSPTDDDCCSICYEALLENTVSVPCKHMFHKDCIEKWCKQQRRCPLCRRELNSCQLCGDKRVIEFQEYFSEIPEHLNQSSRRNLTDGPYGIYYVYLRHLQLKSIYYDREKNLVIPIMCESADGASYFSGF